MYIIMVIHGIVDKCLLQKFVFVFRDTSLCVWWLCTSLWINAHCTEYGMF